MSDFNHIDDLFSDKLKGREVAYSAAAWHGAENLLAKHYKALLIKKILLITIPTLIAGGVGLGILFNSNQDQLPQDDGTAMTAVPIEVDETASHDAASETTVEVPSAELAPTSSDASSNAVTSDLAVTEADDANISDDQSLKVDASTNTKSQDELALNDEESVELDETGTTSQSRIALPPDFGDFLEDLTLEDEPIAAATSSSAGTVKIEEANALLETLNSDMGSMPSFEVGQISKWANGLTDVDRTPEKFMAEIRKIELSTSVGGLLAPGMRGNGYSSKSLSLGYFAGLEGQYYFHPRFFAESGVIISSRGATNSGFDSGNGSSFWTPTNLRYIDIPIRVGYRFGTRHQVSFGLAFSPLINYNIKEESSAGAEVPLSTSLSKNTSRDGFANFDVAAMLNYKFQVSDRIDVKLEGRFGAFDVTDNAYFGGGIIDDRNHQLRLGLSYRLIRR